MKTDVNGCCAMKNNGEQWEMFKYGGKEYVQYDRRVNGKLYSCTAKSLEIAREKIDKEIKNNAQ